MFDISAVDLSLLLAIVACVLGGVLGGLVLAGRAPQPLGATVDAAGPLGRGMGGALIAAHGAVAGMLGYDPRVGACMAITLTFAWLGAAAGRILIARRLKLAADGPSLGFEILMAVALAAPFWAVTTALSRSGVTV
jgi:hypothetical protein